MCVTFRSEELRVCLSLMFTVIGDTGVLFGLHVDANYYRITISANIVLCISVSSHCQNLLTFIVSSVLLVIIRFIYKIIMCM